ncbi:FAD-binding and (Fe-S)-binding domain-containing protein [Mangrovimonas sp. DI 80]|uniref:FAD-binding and (Fe-S)-binding domain-containing protein n=1 Tax=Mangrovimonas sp. DI 80 TaxID=1779330 RepID=UPI000977FCFD|nr:FAD-binding and (Fe-S)-binding domain-containing protein [Mangrovimonas sp. DI 80]OMP30787.1 FAD-binding oxidoreductase [Mangrovimonas sp. DI 80]
MTKALQTLEAQLDGELYYDDLMKSMYATDASVYRMLPLAVAYPKSEKDIQALISFASSNNTSLIPRTAGTSLAGQCVGPGIVVDVSKYFTKILNINERERTVTVEPGVVRDALNNYLKPFGLFFSPNTSTSNRCMIGGMVGNNSSGSTSIKYGVTRDKVLAVKTILSDGNTVLFESISSEEFHEKMKQQDIEGRIYKTIYEELESKEVLERIVATYPKPEIHRRNTGYAIDELIKSEIFSETETSFNMCKLLTGSEGTLAVSTEITLQLDVLPPTESIMIALHFTSIADCMKAVVPVMKHDLYSCEMMDKTILDLTKHNKTQQQNRQFIEGDPEAILMCEVRANSKTEVEVMASSLLKDIEVQTKSYANALLYGDEMDKAIELRKAGLGLLGNMVGDKKSAACIEDTAVALEDLDAYISEFTKLMEGYDQKAIYYAHAGAGELHLRPILNLKLSDDVLLFRKITTDVAHLVKKYNGAMSGEHGEGIVRGEFIPFMIGDENYQILKRIKTAFDPKGIFNPGKIVEAFPMDQSLRYVADRKEPEIETFLDFSESQGILREAEKCNGSGDCRKLPEFGGTMCPSYRATQNEKDTTRARANTLREFLTNSDKPNRFNHEELKEVFDLCLSCKACASECPSSVDMACLKAEFLYQYQKENGISWRTKLFAYNNAVNRFGSLSPRLTNFMFSNKTIASALKNIMQVAPERTLPLISSKSLSSTFKSVQYQLIESNPVKTIYLFNDEFVNYLDTSIGVDFLELMKRLNYQIIVLENVESGRSFLSKGLLEQAKAVANKNVELFKSKISKETPLVGIEPSAILTFRDEYLTLADDREAAKSIAANTFLFEEFFQNEINLGNIKEEQFTQEPKTIKFHGHCHQKALSNQKSSFDVLNFPKNYKVTLIPSGCCGMAGSFGYEKEHYEVSMNIGEQTLFPAIRNASKDVIIAANGTSCRHQIKDGTSVEALHPITVLRQALV